MISTLVVSLPQMAPHAAPDAFTRVALVITLTMLLLGNVGSLPLVLGGGLTGWLRGSVPWKRLLQRATEPLM